MASKNPLLLIILDGWGYRQDTSHNAIAEARTPFFDMLWEKYPHCLLNASEIHVGLPQGTIGNSEIGHMTMGAGRVIDTDLTRISKAMRGQEFHTNPAFAGMFAHIKKYNSTLHILGLLSAGGVHSHQEHLHGFLQAAKAAGLEKVAIHAFTDGRDVPPQSAAKYLNELENVIKDLGIGYIATASGRYYSMDRDKNWHRTDKTVKALFEGFGTAYYARSPSEVLEELYRQGAVDEFLEPIIFFDNNGKSYPIQTNDGVFFFNFRSDRPRQLAARIMEKAKSHNLYFVTLTEYDPSLETEVAFGPVKPETTLAAEISQAGLKQDHIAETEKYAHVTFFFNGGRQDPYDGERDILINSRKDVATHDQAPQMRAVEIADKTLEVLNEGADFVLINFANADMVGHTANQKAIVSAVETVDSQLKRVVESSQAKQATVIITADHGNAEVNADIKTGEKHTAHTLNLVPFILVMPATNYELQAVNGSLADVAPTILQLMDLHKPDSMTGKSLILKN